MVHTEQVITHVSLLEKKTNTVYLTVSEGSICYCLFHMYLTHFYSHVIAEKPFSYMYLTHFYLHVIAEKNILYVPDTLLLTCHCRNQTVCVSGGSVCYCLFCRYPTHFYSDAIAEKTVYVSGVRFVIVFFICT